jgi:hypothetical protein
VTDESFLGLGAGYYEPEYRAFGFRFDHRVGRFEEALQIIHGLLRQGTIDFNGQYYQARDCELAPRGPRPGGPPILIGARADRPCSDLTNNLVIPALSQACAMAGHPIRTGRPVLMPRLIGMTALLCAVTQPAFSDNGEPNAPFLSGAGFHSSQLVAPKSERSCPPTINPMYRADAIVTGTDMRQRPWGFAQTFREVLVKASGDPRLEDDPRTQKLAAHADRLVACFAYADMMEGIPLHDDQGTYDRPHKLTVYFNPAKINAALAQFGRRPWRGERPVIVPVLSVHGRKPPPYVLSADIPAGEEQRGSFAVAAGQFGLRVRFPSDAELAAWNVSTDHFPTGWPASGHSEAVIMGTLDWSETLPGWIGKWRMRWRGADLAWGISGVSYDAAFRNIVRGVVLVASGAGSPDEGN